MNLLIPDRKQTEDREKRRQPQIKTSKLKGRCIAELFLCLLPHMKELASWEPSGAQEGRAERAANKYVLLRAA